MSDEQTGSEVLILRALLSDLNQVPSWVQRLSQTHGFPESTLFAMNVCLEELLSNVILHGYGGDDAHKTVAVRFVPPSPVHLEFVFWIDDEARHFNPLEQPELPPLNPNEVMRVGGQGIRLVRQFADSLEYERTGKGNRLKIGFSAKDSG